MRVTVVSPTSLFYPSPIYYALPLLAGALKDAGHPARLVDLNVQAADHLLTSKWTKRILSQAHRLMDEQSASNRSEEPTPLKFIVENNEPGLLNAPACKEVLRDQKAYFEPALFKNAFSTVLNALSFCYLLDPVISVYSDTFAPEAIAHQQSDPWSPLRDLYDEILIEQVLREDPEMVGISVTYLEQAADSIRLAAKLRQRKKEIHICFGGILLSQFPAKWLENEWIFQYADSAVVGDGETAIVALAEALEGRGDLEEVPNLVYLDAKRKVHKNNEQPFVEDLDQLPVPDFDPVDFSPYLTPQAIYPVMTCRGCHWGHCAFCSEGAHEGFRQASKEKVRTDMKALSEKYGARYIMVQDSCTTPRNAGDLARIVMDDGLPVYWLGAMRIDKTFLQKEYCRELADGGCRSLMLGFESGSQRLLDLMNKGYEVRDLPEILNNLRQAGISAELLWFIGFPTETRDEALETCRFLMKHKNGYGLAVLVGEYALYPDTLLFENVQEFGVTITGQDNGVQKYETDAGMTPEEVKEMTRICSTSTNLILLTNGAHLPYLVEKGLDLTEFGNPLIISDEALSELNEKKPS